MIIRVIDVETTGFCPEKDSVVEIGSVDIIGPLDNEPGISNPMETLIKPAKSDLTSETMGSASYHATDVGTLDLLIQGIIAAMAGRTVPLKPGIAILEGHL